ncbi:MAG TPA: AMP-binding protein, partial [Sphingobium sp.]|nr:AMP-binding protein [Sphingobium sp.]
MTPVLAIMSDLTRRAAETFGDRLAISVLDTGEQLSFARIDELAGLYAGGLAAAGVERGDRVVIHMANGVGWVVAYHAIARLGAVVVPANILLAPAEVAYIAADAGARVILLTADRQDALATALKGAGCNPMAIVHADCSLAAIP